MKWNWNDVNWSTQIEIANQNCKPCPWSVIFPRTRCGFSFSNCVWGVGICGDRGASNIKVICTLKYFVSKRLPTANFLGCFLGCTNPSSTNPSIPHNFYTTLIQNTQTQNTNTTQNTTQTQNQKYLRKRWSMALLYIWSTAGRIQALALDTWRTWR